MYLHTGERSSYNLMRPELEATSTSTCKRQCSGINFRTENMSSPLQDSMEGLIQVFYSYSGKEGDKYKLSKAELINLLNGELSELMTSCSDSTLVDEIMKKLDDNKDGEVDFKEFVNLVAAITVICNEFFVDIDKSKEGEAKK